MITIQRYDETCCYVKSLQPLMSNGVELLTKCLRFRVKKRNGITNKRDAVVMYILMKNYSLDACIEFVGILYNASCFSKKSKRPMCKNPFSSV